MCQYFRSNQLCANFAYVFLNNYPIDFDQASVKILSEKIEKNQKVTGLRFRKRGYLQTTLLTFRGI